MKSLYVTLVVGGMLLAAVPAVQAAQPQAHQKFAECDRNKDGSLTRDEFLACWPKGEKRFTAMDTNHDGKVTKEETRAWAQKRRGAVARRLEEKFAACDKNKDGALSRDEFLAAWPRGAKRFAAMDANHDGKATKEEMHAWVNARRAELKRHSVAMNGMSGTTGSTAGGDAVMKQQ